MTIRNPDNIPRKSSGAAIQMMEQEEGRRVGGAVHPPH